MGYGLFCFFYFSLRWFSGILIMTKILEVPFGKICKVRLPLPPFFIAKLSYAESHFMKLKSISDIVSTPEDKGTYKAK